MDTVTTTGKTTPANTETDKAVGVFGCICDYTMLKLGWRSCLTRKSICIINDTHSNRHTRPQTGGSQNQPNAGLIRGIWGQKTVCLSRNGTLPKGKRVHFRELYIFHRIVVILNEKTRFWIVNKSSSRRVRGIKAVPVCVSLDG